MLKEPESPHNVYFTGLAHDISEAALSQRFALFGRVLEVTRGDGDNGGGRVIFATRSAAEAAVEASELAIGNSEVLKMLSYEPWVRCLTFLGP